jgi:S-formylglutathione hydrolase FrmB
MRIKNKSIKATLISLLFILTLGCNTQAQKQFILKSTFLKSPDTSLVFMPKNMDYMADNLPVLIMLHGYGGDYKQWNNIINIQEYADKYHFIIVCPDGGGKDSWYFDSPILKDSKYESFFIEEYLPYIKNNYPVDTNGIFITGLSMGGHGAMYLFLRHPELFASAGSTSGVLDLNYSGLKYSSLSNKLGEYNDNQERFDEYSSIKYLDNVKFGTSHPFIFDCGNKDHLYQANKNFKAKCDSLGINAFYFSFPGRHNRMYWKESIPWHFEFFNRVYLN